jgi:hypothetical protein
MTVHNMNINISRIRHCGIDIKLFYMPGDWKNDQKAAGKLSNQQTALVILISSQNVTWLGCVFYVAICACVSVKS